MSNDQTTSKRNILSWDTLPVLKEEKFFIKNQKQESGTKNSPFTQEGDFYVYQILYKWDDSHYIFRLRQFKETKVLTDIVFFLEDEEMAKEMFNKNYSAFELGRKTFEREITKRNKKMKQARDEQNDKTQQLVQDIEKMIEKRDIAPKKKREMISFLKEAQQRSKTAIKPSSINQTQSYTIGGPAVDLLPEKEPIKEKKRTR